MMVFFTTTPSYGHPSSLEEGTTLDVWLPLSFQTPLPLGDWGL